MALLEDEAQRFRAHLRTAWVAACGLELADRVWPAWEVLRDAHHDVR